MLAVTGLCCRRPCVARFTSGDAQHADRGWNLSDLEKTLSLRMIGVCLSQARNPIPDLAGKVEFGRDL
jgi:hypothetical protein